MCEAVRRELAPWNTRVVLIGPADGPPDVAARAVAQALTEVGAYGVDAAFM
jgi:hypothetical protein